MTDDQSLRDIELLLRRFPGVTGVRITRDRTKDEVYIAYRCSSLDSIKNLVMCTSDANVPLHIGDPRSQFDGERSDDLPFYIDVDRDSEGEPQTQLQIFGIFLARYARAEGLLAHEHAERLEAGFQLGKKRNHSS